MIWFALVVLFVFAVGAVPQSEPGRCQLPPDLLREIGARLLPGPDRVNFALASKSVLDDMRPMLCSDRVHRRLLTYLSDSGQHDGAWLAVVADVLAGLRMPPLPADFPPALMDAIQNELNLAPPPPTMNGTFVDRIRALYPAEFRGLFPHNHLVAKALLQSPDCRPYLQSVDWIAQLYAFGVGFPISSLLAATGHMPTSVKPYALPDFGSRSPWQPMVDLHDAALYGPLLDLLQDPVYLKQHSESVPGGLSLLIPSISVGLFRRLVHLPTVRPLVDGPLSLCDDHCGLMLAAVRAGRIDLAAVLVAETETKTDLRPPYWTPDGLGWNLPMTPSSIRAYVGLCRYPRFRPDFEADLDNLFVRLARSFTPDTLPDLLRAGDDVADLLVGGGRSSRTGRTFMHALVLNDHFALIRAVLLHDGQAVFRTPDQGDRTAIAYLPAARVAAFVDAALPEPKAAALARFAPGDLVATLQEGIFADKCLGPFDAVFGDVYRGDLRAAVSGLGVGLVWAAFRLRLRRWWVEHLVRPSQSRRSRSRP